MPYGYLLELFGKKISSSKKYKAVQIASILKYTKERQTISRLVDKEYTKQLKNIVSNFKIYKNSVVHSLFINEFGVYSLLLKSNRSEAKPFFTKIIKSIIF